MAVKIYMTSLKGGTGVTTCAIGLGLALAESGMRTLVFDGDEKCAGGLGAAGMWGLNVYTLGDAQNGDCRVKQAILQRPHSPNFYIIPTLGCTDKNYPSVALSEIEGLFDYILCDETSPSVCNRALVVTDPYNTSVKCADKRIAELRDGGFKDVGVIVNKVNGGLVFDGRIMMPQEIAAILHAPLTAVIPEDLSIPLGKWKKSSVAAFKIAADFISGKSKKTLSVIKPYAGVGGLIKRKMREKI